MRFRPCIDIHQGKVKQIVGSTLSDDMDVIENFVADKPADYFAKLYKSDALSGGHVIMLDNQEQTQQQALEALQEYPKGFQIGGGINDQNAGYWLDNGASQVILTSFAFKDGKINYTNLEKIVDCTGKKKIVLDLSCRKKGKEYFVVTDKWKKFTNYCLNKENVHFLEKFCSEFLIHAVDVEGKSAGIQRELVRGLRDWVNIPTTYAGGVRSISDLELAKVLGKGKIDLTIGSALDIFGGNLEYRKVITWFKNQ